MPRPIAAPPPIGDEKSGPGWFGQKRLGLPQGLWLLIVLAVIGGGVAVVATRGDDSGTAFQTVPTEETDRATPTAPAETEATTAATDAPPATSVDTTVEATLPETTQPPTDEIAGSPAGLTGDRDHPVPAGQVADVGGGWRLQVLSVNPDAAAAIAEANPFNDPPPAGSTFTLVTVAIGYFGRDDPKSGYETTISAVDAGNVALPEECGVIPQPVDLFAAVFAGGVVTGNLCYVTTPANASSLRLYAQGDFFGDDQVFLDASTSPASATPMAALAGPQAGAKATAGRAAPIPLGTPADVGGGWTVSVTAAASDITDALVAGYEPAPADGYRYIGVGVTYAYAGEGSSSPFTVTTNAVGSSNVALSTNCGYTSDQIDFTADVFAGGSVSGTICFVVPAGDPSFVLYSNASFDGPSVTFASS